MNPKQRRLFRYVLAVVGVVAIAFGIFITTHAQAVTEPGGTPDWTTVESSGQPDPALATTVERDTCLHCHISGEDKGLWTPFARWLVFGSVGM
ncbi:MAG: hypothetical protein JXB38_05455, partial [Anaerolineales bacterium]|nr:hypothetical protein [Anaerolineales bacterium]